MGAEPQRSRVDVLRQTLGPARHVDGLDKLIHERMRLGIVSALAVKDKLTFVELKEVLDATDGNLSVHARKLEMLATFRVRRRSAGVPPKRSSASRRVAGEH